MGQRTRDVAAFIGRMFEDGAKIMLLLFLTLAVAMFVTQAAMAITHRYPLDYGEGPLLDQAMRLASGQNIYRPDLASPPYTISNYPPLYPLSLVPFVKLFGPSFAAGRIISTLCSLASALFLGQIVYHTGARDRLAGLITGLLFLAFPYVVDWSKLLRVDMLALAFSTAGLVVLVRYHATWRGVIGSGLLLVAAAYTRQSYGLAAPLAAFVWLWVQDRRKALGLAMVVGGVGLVLLLFLNLLTQGGFFFNIVTANVNEFGIDRLAHHWRDLRHTAPVLLVLGGLYLFFAPGRIKPWALVVPYLVGATLSAATIGKIGSNVNYLLELCAALSLAAGTLTAWVRERQTVYARWLRAAMLVLLALQVGQLMQSTLQGPVSSLKWRLKPVGALGDMERLIGTAEGPVLADTHMGMLSLQNQPLYIQPFEVTQLAEAGLWDQSDFVASIRDQAFPLILIRHFMEWPVYRERWTSEMMAAINEGYAPTRFLAETIVFQPRDGETEFASLPTCPDAPWRLPTGSNMGMWWLNKRLFFMGEGFESDVPVYAVADGLLTRRPEWHGAVAIQHDDPLRLGEKVWSFYGGMASGWEDESFVQFQPGSEEVSVTQGQLLGYQGRRVEGTEQNIWVHLQFAVVPAEDDGSFPVVMMERLMKGESLPKGMAMEFPLDPSPYLRTVRSQVAGRPAWLPWQCQEHVP